MKKFLLCVVALFLFGSSVAQQDVNNFWGISFGSSVDDVKIAMKDRGMLFVETPGDNGLRLIYLNCSFAGNANCIVAIQFFDSKMSEGTVLVQSTEESVFSKYDSMAADLSEKYGAPTEVTKKFKLPYYDGDGCELEALKNGKASFLTHWNRDVGIASLFISEDLKIALMYYDKELRVLEREREKSAPSSDY